MSTPLPKDSKADVLVEALQSCGPGWHSRNAIAQHLNKKRLSAVEEAVLDALAAQGALERETEPTNSPQIHRYVYRIPTE